MKKAEKPKRVHKCLKGDGFDTDGTHYWLSPGRVQWKNSIQGQAAGLQELVNAVNAYAAELYQEVAKEKRRWWIAVWNDIGVAPHAKETSWSYSDIDGSIKRVGPKPKLK